MTYAQIALFAIQAGLRLYGAACKAYADSVRGRALILPLPRAPGVEVDTAENWFLTSESGIKIVEQTPRIRWLMEQTARSKAQNAELVDLYRFYRAPVDPNDEDAEDVRGKLTNDEMFAMLEVRQWSDAEAGGMVTPLQTITGTLVNIAIDYFVQTPGVVSEERSEGRALKAFSYDARDRLLACGNLNYSYTPAGELQLKTDTGVSETTTYGYDTTGNLIGADLPDGTEIAYIIDGLGNRIGVKVDGILVQGFLYDFTGQIVAELNSAGEVTARFVYGARGTAPEYMVKGGRTYRIITDQLGSPRMVVDSEDGTVVQELEYDSFGQVLKDTNPGFQPFGFAGGLLDSRTGLYHFGAREYDAETGRWTSADPLGFASGDTNLYTYVRNDPVNAVDPDGLQMITLPDPELGPDPPSLPLIDLGNPPPGWEDDEIIYTQLAGSRCVSHCKSRARSLWIKLNKMPSGLPPGTLESKYWKLLLLNILSHHFVRPKPLLFPFSKIPNTILVIYVKDIIP